MKKVSIAIGFVILVVLGFGVRFYWKNLRGSRAAFGRPASDIVGLIENSQEKVEGENTTGFPLSLPEGFSIGIFAKDLGAPRVLARDPNGVLLVSLIKDEKVVALPDSDGDGVVDQVVTVVDNLDRPHGLAFLCEKDCRLYVAETDQVAVYDYDENKLRASNKKKIVDLPGGGRHFSRTIMFDGRQEKLLISVGSSCDTCVENDFRRAAILSVNPDGSGIRVFAKGLRNSVFMKNHPMTGQVWASEMGRDQLGDDLPPDEINIVESGKDYGWPFCYGKQVHDGVFDKSGSRQNFCGQTSPSLIDLQAHSSPLGLDFIEGDKWPEEIRGDLLVAYHGSWNRTEPTGYKIVRFELDEKGKPVVGNFSERVARSDFISGWLQGNSSLGRPVDVLVGNGEIFISDDKAGVVYRAWI